MAKVVKDASGCWMFGGAPNPVNGYCGIYVHGAGTRPAHRVAYELLVGPIPVNMEIDHLCHTWDRNCPGGMDCSHRRCVNPEHLEPVSRMENHRRSLSPAAINERKTHCDSGHEFTPSNTILRKLQTPAGLRERRACRECERQWRTKRPPRRQGSAAPAEIRRSDPSELKTHCKNGHEFTPENTYVKPYWHGDGGFRQCRECMREQQRAYRERRRVKKRTDPHP
ncbi:HNH endonuclease [Streptomyces sp. ISL-112]|nr:HNH endonuclease [Streptomyces sp. ISL-112]MBT2465856.1 HNH endonuclease [Streptomyces sp. ISL-63]